MIFFRFVLIRQSGRYTKLQKSPRKAIASRGAFLFCRRGSIIFCPSGSTPLALGGQTRAAFPFDKKPRFSKYPFGKLGVIAHVSCQKELYAISIDGKMYDMNKMWEDAYLYEVFIHIMNNIINEAFCSYKRQMLLESRSRVIRLNESQLRDMIQNIVNKLIA